MDSFYRQHWQGLETSRRLRRAIAISVVAHLTFGLAAFSVSRSQRPVRQENLYTVQFIPIQAQSPAKEPSPEPPKTEPPKVEPPKPELPKPEPEPEKKPEPPKLKPTPEKKPEPPKPKPEKKPEPPKAKPPPEKKAQPKPPKQETKPKPEQIPLPSAPPPLVQGVPTGVSMKDQLPTVLDAWGRLVQLKVEKYWQAPPGIRLDLENNQAEIAFWVDKQGNLIGEPEIMKRSGDPALDESGVRAIKLSAPLPPLPDDYAKSEQQVVYVFRLVQ
jgi:colicin import membrane protein